MKLIFKGHNKSKKNGGKLEPSFELNPCRTYGNTKQSSKPPNIKIIGPPPTTFVSTIHINIVQYDIQYQGNYTSACIYIYMSAMLLFKIVFVYKI